MPNLCIIPFRALEDGTMTPAQLRVLCAIGAHTDREGAGVWASAATLADEARCDRATFFRAAKYLESQGFVQRTARYSETDGHQLTSMYRVLLDAPNATGGVASERDGGRRKAVRPKRPQVQRHPLPQRDGRKLNDTEPAQVKMVFDAYPPRHEPYHWLSAQSAILALIRNGVSAKRLANAASAYYAEMERSGSIGTQYVRGIARFFAEGYWKTYDIPRVYGRTREEWARSGQDVTEFDRLLAEHTTTTENHDERTTEDAEDTETAVHQEGSTGAPSHDSRNEA